MIGELGWGAFAFVALACVISGLAHGALGFGFPIVATPLVALVVDIKTAIALLAPVTLVLVVISALRGGPLGAIAREFWPLLAGGALGAWLGTRLLFSAPPEPFILVLALVILLYLNLERLGRGTSPLVRELRTPFGLAFGLTAGLFEAIANVAGPVLLIYFMLLGLAPMQLVQALNLCFTISKGVQSATWAASGEIGARTWLIIGGLVLPAVAALLVGMRLRARIDAATYRRWLRGALWLMATVLLVQFATRVAASDEALFQAIERDDEALAQALVLRGDASLQARDANGETPLHRAVERGLKGLARLLIERGADVNAPSKNRESPLHLAALEADPALVDLLLAAGADPHARNADGESVLMWAALSGHIVVASRLLQRGADANVADLKGSLPLHAAADGGHVELVRLLLPRTANPQHRNREGLSARDYARRSGYERIEKLLKGTD